MSALISNALGAVLVVFLSGMATAACLCVFQLTDFLAEYGTLMCRLFKSDLKFNTREEFLEWMAKKSAENGSSVAEFFYRLLWCPYCLGTWFALFFSAISGLPLRWIPVVWFASMWVGVLLRLLIAKLDTEERDA